MIKPGISEQAKVIRSAVENAASVAAMIPTTEALVTDLPADSNGVLSMPGGMGMDNLGIFPVQHDLERPPRTVPGWSFVVLPVATRR